MVRDGFPPEGADILAGVLCATTRRWLAAPLAASIAAESAHDGANLGWGERTLDERRDLGGAHRLVGEFECLEEYARHVAVGHA